MKVRILKTRNYRDGIGVLKQGQEVDLDEKMAKQFIAQGCAEDVSIKTPLKRKKIEEMIEENESKSME